MKKQTISNSIVDRENILNNPFALKNIQKEFLQIPYFEFEKKVIILKQDVIDFFQVSEDSIDRTLSENSAELKKNGYEVISGKRVAGLKKTIGPRKFAGTKTTRIGVFDFRSFLNLSMVLTGSVVAEKTRSRILDIVVSTLHKKVGSNRKYINQRDDTFLPSYVSNADVRNKFTRTLGICVEGNNNKYPHFTNLIYVDLFGEDAVEYRKLLKLGDRENVRSTFYREILDIVSGYEEGISAALKENYEKKGKQITLDQAEALFNKCFQSPFLRIPKETARRLMASRDKAFREIIHEALLPYIEALPEEEYKKFLSEKSKVIGGKTKDIIALIDKNKEVFDRLKDK